MTQPLTVRDIVDAWPTRAALAAAMVESGAGVTAARVHKWVERGAIPAEFHAALLRAAEACGKALTAADLARAHDVALRSAPTPTAEDAA